ncbi:hypothetical protein MHK_004466 [Candidatus Magnetomorum sp. HK-1]|nr:hypothetical protein MHK_004466 [Candidatus Magnetomorum sp. HK-1]
MSDFLDDDYMIRSLGDWTEVKKIRSKGMDRLKGDERILDDSDFVLSVICYI